MRLPDIFEVIVAILATMTVMGAIVAILFRVTRGNPEKTRLEALQRELEAEKTSKP